MATSEEQPQSASDYDEFLASPVGQARVAYQRGDKLFQCSIAVASQEAVLMALHGTAAPSTSSDPSQVLNWVCNEGWELVNGSFVFIEQGHQTRKQIVTSGQEVAIKGETVGYYLFRRCEANRVWNQPDEAPAS